MGKGEIFKPPKAEIAASQRLGHMGEKFAVHLPLCARGSPPPNVILGSCRLPGPRFSHPDTDNDSSAESMHLHTCPLKTETLEPEQDGVPDPRISPDDRNLGFQFLVVHGSHHSTVIVSKRQDRLKSLQLLLALKWQ